MMLSCRIASSSPSFLMKILPFMLLFLVVVAVVLALN